MTELAGDRPLTFLTPAHLSAAAAMPDGVVIATPCGCGGSWITYRACSFDALPLGASVVATHIETVSWAAQSSAHGVPQIVREIVRDRAIAGVT